MLTLFLTDIGQEIELVNETVKYTKQCNDIADLSSREANYTDSSNAPKNSHNTYVLNQLGLAGDTSVFPYQKVKASLLDNGIPLVKDGWLNIKETAKDYKLHIYDGIIDLFKAIENKTFGDDVDLSEINHDKNLTNVLASFTNPNYRYIVNDYGGKTHLVNKNINIDYLVPSVSWSYLWNKIFSTFGFVSIGDFLQSEDFTGLWLTFPKGIAVDASTTQIYEATTGLVANSGLTGGGISFTATEAITISFTLFDNLVLECLDNVCEYGLVVLINGSGYYLGSRIDAGDIITLSTGDVLEVSYFVVGGNITGAFGFQTIVKYGTLQSFSEELKNLKITDFFKEVLWRIGLTIFKDKDGNYIFKTFDERLEADVIDWSEKYVERTSETYTPKSYAQKNNFTEKYNDENANYNDGSFLISNKNLNESYDVIKSNFYSAEKELQSFYINNSYSELLTPTPLWEKETNENNGSAEIKYKSLSNRFYVLRSENQIKTTTFKSELLGNSQSVTEYPVAIFANTKISFFVSKYYKNINLLLNDFRFHKIKLALNINDFVNLDFDKIYYFEQEQNYYILNKVSYEKCKLASAEFYRIKYKDRTVTLGRHYSPLHYSPLHYSTNLI